MSPASSPSLDVFREKTKFFRPRYIKTKSTVSIGVEGRQHPLVLANESSQEPVLFPASSDGLDDK